MVAHKRDEVAYRRHLFAFKKAFPNFICYSLDSTWPSSTLQEVEEVKYCGVVENIQQEKPHKLRGGW